MANSTPAKAGRPISFPVPLEIPLNSYPTAGEYSPREEGHGKKPSASRRQQMRMTMLSGDWLADMVNNNVEEGEEVKKAAANQEAFGPVMQLINVSVKKERSDDLTQGPCVFNALNLTFTVGRIFVVIGEPRSGKTALLQTLAKMRPPASGKVKYLGPRQNRSKARLSAGFMAQRDGYFASFSPVENLLYLAKLYCIEPVVAHNKLHRLMTMIGWDRKSVPMSALSPVHQTLVSLALASLHSPAILLLDEPNFGADLFLKEHIWRQLKKLTQNDHVTIIFASSTVEDVRFADEAAIVRGKSLVPCVLSPSLGLDASTPVEPKLSDVDAVVPIDIQSLLSVDVEKIRQYVATSYQLQSEADLELNEADGSGKGKGKSNRAFSKSTSVDSDIHLEMSWSSGHPDSPVAKSAKRTALKRIHREPRFTSKVLLTFLLLLKLMSKRPVYLLNQLLLPALLVLVLGYFVGQNPYDIPVAVFNPDQPAIVSRHVLNSLDKHTIRVLQFATLEEAVDAVRQHLAWAVIEFPANYTNSMINRALQNCESDGDFDEEPDAESISGHLIDSDGHRRQFEKISSSTLPGQPDEDADLARVYRNRIALRTRRSLEKEEHEADDGHGSGSTSTASPDDAGESEAHALGNDIDVNHKKLKPINLITIRLHMDNTNLLVSGFIKAQMFHALQRAQADSSLSTLSPKIPSPLELVAPNIYGHEDTPMADFLLPGTLVIVFFLSAAILPLPALSQIKRVTVFHLLGMTGIGRLLLVAVFTTIQLIILAAQIALALLLVLTVLDHPIAGSLVFSFALLYLQGTVALLLTTLACFSINATKPGFIAMILHFSYFTALIIFGGIYWPLECMPLKVRPIVVHLFPQTVTAEALRYIFARGWGWERFFDRQSNDIIWWAVNLPVAWIAGLLLMVMVTVKLY